MTQTTAPPGINHAAQRLIEALEDADTLPGFRVGFTNHIVLTRLIADSKTHPARHEAAQLLPVWQAIEELAAAVAQRKEARHG